MNEIRMFTEYQLLDTMIGYDYWRQIIYCTNQDAEYIIKLLMENGHTRRTAKDWVGKYVNVI